MIKDRPVYEILSESGSIIGYYCGTPVAGETIRAEHFWLTDGTQPVPGDPAPPFKMAAENSRRINLSDAPDFIRMSQKS